MNNTSALKISQEIVPLFNCIENNFSKEVLADILSEPLKSREEILSRQEILKGFIANHDILKNYSYSQLDFFEVYNFLASHYTQAIPKLTLMIDLQFSKEERHRMRSKFIQIVLLFHKLHHFYFKRVDIQAFPECYRHELQKATVFLEDLDLIYNERLIRENKVRIRNIVDFMDLLSRKVTNGKHSAFWKCLFLFEAYLSISKTIIRHNFTFPAFTENDFSFKSLYHPLLKQPIKNDITLNHKVIIFTGPNMSGKSTFLKALGLSVYLGHLGLAVPAEKAVMPYFDSISIAINLNDDIMQGYSHFMTELKNLKHVVTDASDNRKCFAIFDELFRGTNIEDALHISSSTIIGLTQFNNSYFLISTHLGQLKDMAVSQENKIAAFYFDCDLRNGSPSFNYQLKKGWSELKIGKILFNKEGLADLLNPGKS